MQKRRGGEAAPVEEPQSLHREGRVELRTPVRTPVLVIKLISEGLPRRAGVDDRCAAANVARQSTPDAGVKEPGAVRPVVVRLHKEVVAADTLSRFDAAGGSTEVGQLIEREGPVHA